jgi:hypothetical protein
MAAAAAFIRFGPMRRRRNRSTCPPSAAVRQSSIADMTRRWPATHMAGVGFAPSLTWRRKISATSNFGGDKERTAEVYRADPDEVRTELLSVLAQARSAQSFPWDTRRTLHWRTVFPQMTNWLPEQEAAELRFEFETEIRRLEGQLAP